MRRVAAREQPAQVSQVLLAACAGQKLHANWIAHGDLRTEELIDANGIEAEGLDGQGPQGEVDRPEGQRAWRISPPTMVSRTPMLAMSAGSTVQGSSSSTTRSASFPGSMVPLIPSSKLNRAASLV